jgi:hypothetical protein
MARPRYGSGCVGWLVGLRFKDVSEGSVFWTFDDDGNDLCWRLIGWWEVDEWLRWCFVWV